MTRKPTYEELEKQVKELNKEALVLREEKKTIQKRFNFAKIILSATPDFLVLKDHNLVYQAVNPAFCEFLGKTEGNIIGKTDFDLFPRVEAERYRQDDLKIIKTGKPQTQDEEVTGEDEKRLFRVVKTPVPIEEGTRIGVLCSVVDITDYKKVEKELQKKTNDLKGRVKELNCLYGISKVRERKDSAFEEMLQEIVDLIPSSWQYPEITCARIIIEGQEYKTKNFKETIWKQTSKIVVHGRLNGILEVCYLEEKPERDEGSFLKEERSLISAITERLGRVTEHKRSEEALRESEKKYRYLSEGTFEAVVWHHKGKIIEANKQYYEMFGYKPEELIGKDAILLTATSDSAKFMREQITSGYLGPYEVVGRKKDGTEFPMEIRVKGMEYKGIEARMAAIRDLTERKQAEEALVKAHAELGKRVKERTRDLEIKTQNLEELNIALQVLLDKRQEDKKETSDNLLTNVKELIAPYLEKIKKTKLDEQQKTIFSILEHNLNEITSPFARKMSQTYLNLTPIEIKVANLIRHGRNSKEIAELMRLSPRTIYNHRKNIRKKLGLEDKQTNLRSYLLSIH